MATIALFDVDGTLTKPRNVVTGEMRAFMSELRKKVPIGIVGGSDLVKIKEQLGDNCISEYDYVFAQNGLEAFKGGENIAETVRTHCRHRPALPPPLLLPPKPPPPPPPQPM